MKPLPEFSLSLPSAAPFVQRRHVNSTTKNRAFPRAASVGLLLVFLLTGAPPRAAEISWSTFTGGGGISQSGAVALGGAIGPIAPALSTASGGDYGLLAEFWAAFSGQPQPALPMLKIKPLGEGTVQLSWPLSVSGFVLQYTTQLGSGLWQPEPTAVVPTLTEHTVTIPVAPALHCYRLFAP